MWRLASLKLSTSNLVSGDIEHQHLQAGPPDVYSFSHSTEGNGVVPKAPRPVGRKDGPGLHANLGLWGGQMAGRTCSSQEAGLARQKALTAFPAHL